MAVTSNLQASKSNNMTKPWNYMEQPCRSMECQRFRTSHIAGEAMFFFTKYIYQILDRYRTHIELIDTIPIGFTGVASERPAPIFTNEVSEDVLYFAAAVSFSNAGAFVRIRSISPQYEWMADDSAVPQDTPINAIAGVFSQALPILPLVQPFFVKK